MRVRQIGARIDDLLDNSEPARQHALAFTGAIIAGNSHMFGLYSSPSEGRGYLICANFVKG